jgi:hypothetical protein
MRQTIAATFYTPEYAAEAQGLRDSCKTFGIPLIESERKSRGSWSANCNQKPEVILSILESLGSAYSGVLWVDADARFRRVPEFEFSEMDFAYFRIPRVFKRGDAPWGAHHGTDAVASGTLYFRFSGSSLSLLRRWIDECDARPSRWDQQSLQAALGGMLDRDLIRVGVLPQGWCKVVDCRWFPGEKREVVIEHMQASRRLKRHVRRRS